MKKKNLSKWISLIVVLCMTAALAACGGGGAKSEAAAPAAEAQKEEAPASKGKIAYCTQQLSNEFMQSLKDAVVGACEAAGYECEVFSADLDPSKQISQIETAVNEKYDGIILDPASADAVIPGVQYAQENKVPIVTMHEDVANGAADATSKSDFKQGGMLKMQACVDAIGGKGDIAIINGELGQTATAAIREGYQEILDKYPDVHIQFEDAGDWSTESAVKIIESWVATGENMDAIIGMNDAMALGIISVIEGTKYEGIPVFGLDAQKEMLKMIKEGKATGTILTDLKGEAAGAVDAITKLIAGQTVEKVNIVDMVLITKDNVDEYMDY